MQEDLLKRKQKSLNKILKFFEPLDRSSHKKDTRLMYVNIFYIPLPLYKYSLRGKEYEQFGYQRNRQYIAPNYYFNKYIMYTHSSIFFGWKK